MTASADPWERPLRPWAKRVTRSWPWRILYALYGVIVITAITWQLTVLTYGIIMWILDTDWIRVLLGPGA